MFNTLSMRKVACLAILVLLVSCASTGPKVPEATQSYYNRVLPIAGKLITSMDPANGSKYRVAIPQVNDVQAYATAEYRIVLTTGLINLMDNGELTFILAHEIAHITLGHHATVQLASGATTAVTTIAGLFIPGAGLLNYLANPLVTNAFGRPQELAADKEAVRVMETLGINKSHAASALTKLRNIADNSGGVFDSHPAMEERIRLVLISPRSE